MSVSRVSQRLEVGAVVPPHEWTNIHGKPLRVPDERRVVHLQFRRFAGCPVCNLHLRSIVRRHDKIVAAGVREVVVFHSTAQDLLPHAGDLPFDVVADPEKRLYAKFGVESAPRALLNPRAWFPVLRGIVVSAWGILGRREAIPPINPDGGSLGLPADFLIAPDGRVVACKHGDHAYDQWSVDELLALAGSDNRAPGDVAAASSLLNV